MASADASSEGGRNVASSPVLASSRIHSISCSPDAIHVGARPLTVSEWRGFCQTGYRCVAAAGMLFPPRNPFRGSTSSSVLTVAALLVASAIRPRIFVHEPVREMHAVFATFAPWRSVRA